MTSSHDIAALVADSAWVRRLAGQLVADADLADEVAQEAALAALQSSARVRSERGWWRGVVRHVAANPAEATASR